MSGEALVTVIRATLSQLGLEEGCKEAARVMVDQFEIRGVAIFLHDPGERSLIPVAVFARQGDVPIVEERIALRISKEGILYRALRSDRPVRLDECCANTNGDALDLSRNTPVCLMPLRYHGNAVGLMAVMGKDSTLLEEDLLDVADHLGWALGLAKDLQDLKRSEEKYRALTEDASDIVFAIDSVGRFTFLNSRVRDVLGYEPEELMGRFLSSILTPESWDETAEALKRARSKRKRRLFCRWETRCQSGVVVVLDVHSSLLERGSRYMGQQGIARDNTDIRRMEEELLRSRRTQVALKDYIALVTRVQEEERQRIARDLHDDTVQFLTAISRGLDLCLDKDSREMGERLFGLKAMADLALENLRRFMRDLRPAVLDDLGLSAAMEGLVGEARKRGIDVEWEVTGAERRLAADTEVALFRIAQEALNNAIRHSGCDRVSVRLKFEEGGLVISVEDEGVGFHVPQDVSFLAPMGKLGLLGMRERADLVGGSLSVISVPGEGTRVTVRCEA